MSNYAELIAAAVERELMARRDAISADTYSRADRFAREAEYHSKVAAALRAAMAALDGAAL